MGLLPTGARKWGKVKTRSPPGNAPPKVSAVHKSTCRLPYEILEGIIAHNRDIALSKRAH